MDGSGEIITADRATRRGEILAELAELTLSAAHRMHGRLMAAETPQEVAEAGLAFQRVSRSLRQTLLLETRFETDREAAARAEAEQGAAARKAPAEVRKARVRSEVVREIVEQTEDLEHAEELIEDLDKVFNAYVDGHDFAGEGLEPLIVELCAALDLPRTRAPVADASMTDRAARETPAEPGPRLVQMPGGGWAPDSS